jgi:hypothetical protein
LATLPPRAELEALFQSEEKQRHRPEETSFSVVLVKCDEVERVREAF